MIYIRLVQSGPWEYEIESGDSLELKILGRFLGVDVGGKDAKIWEQWLTGPEKRKKKSGRKTLVEKKEDRVVISDLYSDARQEMVCEIGFEELCKLLDKWDSLCKNNAQEIIIYKENGRICLDGKNLLPPT